MLTPWEYFQITKFYHLQKLRNFLMMVPNNSKFAYPKGQIELYFNFKAKNLSKNYIFRNPLNTFSNKCLVVEVFCCIYNNISYNLFKTS